MNRGCQYSPQNFLKANITELLIVLQSHISPANMRSTCRTVVVTKTSSRLILNEPASRKNLKSLLSNAKFSCDKIPVGK